MKSLEQRVNQLEKKVEKLANIIEAEGLNKKFLPLPLAARRLHVTQKVIRYRLKKDKNIIFNKHYRMNGTHYLINVEEWNSLIASDAKARLD